MTRKSIANQKFQLFPFINDHKTCRPVWNWKFHYLQHGTQNWWHSQIPALVSLGRIARTPWAPMPVQTGCLQIRNWHKSRVFQNVGGRLGQYTHSTGKLVCTLHEDSLTADHLGTIRGSNSGENCQWENITEYAGRNPRGKNWSGFGVKSQGCGCWQWKRAGWGLVYDSKPSDWNRFAVVRETGFSVTMIGANQMNGISWYICQWDRRVPVGFESWDLAIA